MLDLNYLGPYDHILVFIKCDAYIPSFIADPTRLSEPNPNSQDQIFSPLFDYFNFINKGIASGKNLDVVSPIVSEEKSPKEKFVIPPVFGTKQNALMIARSNKRPHNPDFIQINANENEKKAIIKKAPAKNNKI